MKHRQIVAAASVAALRGSRRAATVGVAGALIAGAAWFGLGATEAAAPGGSPAAGGDKQGAFTDHLSSARMVDSVAEGERLAARAGLRGQTLTVIFRTTRQVVVEVDEDPAFSTGDFFWGEGKVFNSDDTQLIGQVMYRCELAIRFARCDSTIRLTDRGKILGAETQFPGDHVGSVLGGTGNFKNVTGQFMIFGLESGGGLLVYELQR